MNKMTINDSDKARILKNISSDGIKVLEDCLNAGERNLMPHFSEIVETSDRTGILYIARHVTPYMRFMRVCSDDTIVDSEGRACSVPPVYSKGRIIYTEYLHKNMPDVVVRKECNAIFGNSRIHEDHLLSRLLPFCQVFTFIEATCCSISDEDSLMYQWASMGRGNTGKDLHVDDRYTQFIRDKSRTVPMEQQIYLLSNMVRKNSRPLDRRHHIIPVYSKNFMR
jgi:hypothetical protein